MRKEVFLAIIIGTLLGLWVMLTWESNKRGWFDKFLPEKPSSVENESSPIPTLPNKKEPQLTILEPEDETISTKEKITIKGAVGLSEEELSIIGKPSLNKKYLKETGNYSV